MAGKNKTLSFTLIQCLYWMTHCLTYSYTSAFLLHRGFSNSVIGVVLGLSYALSALMQPAVAAFVQRSGVRLSSFMACVYAVVALLAAALLILPMENMALAAAMVCLLLLHSALQPSVNSLHRSYQLQGVQINFGFARGMGSAAYSLIMLAAGQLVSIYSPDLIPAMYLCTVLLLILCLTLYRSPVFPSEEKSVRSGGGSLLRRHPRFALFLLGLIFLALAQMGVDNFMLQIMRSKGGDSAEMGVAMAIAAVAEMPAMIFYSRISRRIGPRYLLCITGWAWLLKIGLTMLSPTPQMIYLAQLLQFLSYAIYVPATVDYISRSLPQTDFLKGQALAGSAFTLGSLLASFLGGRLIDLMGVSSMLTVMVALCAVGAGLFSVALLGREQKPA